MSKTSKTTKTVAKTSKTVAKTAKAAPKGKAKVAKVAKAAKAERAPQFADEAKFVVLTKENPRREGTKQHKWFAALMKLSGKTVAEAREKVECGAVVLRYAVKEGHARVNG